MIKYQEIYINRLNNAIFNTLQEIAKENPLEAEGKDIDKIFNEWRDEYSHVNYLIVDLLY